jgi:hypothetical protein
MNLINSVKGNILRCKIEKIGNRRCLVGLSIVLMFIFKDCEDTDRFYRPNLPEKLCSIGIIDVDDTSAFSFSLHDIRDVRNSMRYITFEKSYQPEYPNEITDSLHNFSFNISNGSEDVFSFNTDSSIKNLLKFELPKSLIFYSGLTYSLKAKERDLPQISASITVPEPPLGLFLKSFKKEVLHINLTTICTVRNIANSVLFEVSFKKNYESQSYYMIIVEGEGPGLTMIPYSGPLDFSVLEVNAPGFFAEMQGLSTYHFICKNGFIDGPTSPSQGYFIDGSKISGDTCNIKLSIRYNDGYSPLEKLTSAKVKLLSIPEELYNFEKALHIYDRNLGDPFSEPVFLNGNISGGNGVFAICRSANLNIAFPLN